jgi:hypothetical protein
MHRGIAMTLIHLFKGSSYRSLRIAGLGVCLATALAACGGGGGGGGNPPPAPVIDMTVPASASATSSTNAAAPSAQVAVTFANAPTTFFLNVATYTTVGIDSVGSVGYGPTNGTFRIYFKAPAGLAPGTYNDTVTVRMCGEPACALPLVTRALAVTYTVTTPSGGTLPTVTLATPNYTHEAVAVDRGAAVVTLANAITFANFVGTPTVRVEPVGTPPVVAQFTQSSATQGTVTLTFRAPTLMAPGTTTSQINFRVCLDTNCTNPVVPATYTLNVTYTIGTSASVAGLPGTTLRAFTINGLRNIDGNPASEFVYGNTGGATPAVLEIDTTDGSTDTFALPAGRSANEVSLTNDAQYLYAATSNVEVQRFTTADRALSATIVTTAPQSLSTIAALPGSPLSFAVSGSGYLAIFDGTTRRTNMPSLSNLDTMGGLQWASPTSLFVTEDVLGAPARLCRYTVDATGVATSHPCGGTLSGFASVGGSLVYERGSPGIVRDPTNWSQVGTLTVPNGTVGQVLLNASGTRLYAYVGFDTNGCSLYSFDAVTRAPIASVRLPTVNPIEDDGSCRYGGRLVRYGADGLALPSQSINQDTALVLIDGPFVTP